MRLRSIGVLLAGMGAGGSAHAQPTKTAVVVIGVSAAYTALSVSAMHRLTESAGPLVVGADVEVVSSVPLALVRQRGRLVAIDADGVTILVGRSPTRIVRRDVRSISVYSGTEAKWAQGWRTGLFAGGAIGAIAGFAGGGSHGGDDRNYSAAEQALGLGLVLAVGGSIVGSAIGAMRGGDHWKPVRRIPWTDASSSFRGSAAPWRSAPRFTSSTSRP